mmetsp:Transcript_7750/g.32059  ORF Transcript_7750/g.32059 Transcript_7750/m.32059 type:complete len:87 (-) Transcript_7750:1379-1639(-)
MAKVDVNGPSAHPVYAYLKAKTSTPRIPWNFGVYFVVDADGVATAHPGAHPSELRPIVDAAVLRAGSGESSSSSEDAASSEEDEEL